MVEASRVVIIGGGFSGTMLAVRLAELGQASTVIEQSGDFGPGLAYSTPFEGHLLNVRSSRMSATETRPEDFVDWLATHRPDVACPGDFAPRSVYGQYLRDRLASTQALRPGLISLLAGRVSGIGTGGVTLADARAVAGRAVVLATGNPSPGMTGSAGDWGLATGPGSRFIDNPWRRGALDGIGPTDEILIIGTGLTMVDVIQSLVSRSWQGHATALSRRGLVPRAHAGRPDGPADLPHEATTGPISKRMAVVRRLARRQNWREVMEAYRPITARLWAEASTDQRARMVRHLRPWWDVHRHRIAPGVARTLEACLAGGQLIIRRGRPAKVKQDEDRLEVFWQPRGRGTSGLPLQRLSVGWVIDCSGPAHSAASDPLTGPLIASRQARLDPLGLGLDLDGCGRVLRADGSAHAGLFVLGPPARAAFWETIAVPDIRKRIEDVAGALAAQPRRPVKGTTGTGRAGQTGPG